MVHFRTSVRIAALLCLGHSVVSAQTAADKAAADALFKEGKKLIATGEIDTACAKFEASLARMPQLGTQLALASCYETLGKITSASGAYRAAASTARKARDVQRQRFAEEHAAALELKLPRLLIKLEPGYRVDGLVVKRNGIEVPPAEMGSPVPVDPGEHVIVASAAGWVDWETKVSVAPMPGVIEVIVPALGKAPVKVEESKREPIAVVSSPDQGSQDNRRPRLHLAYGIGGGGIGVLAASLVFGAMAKSKWSDAQTHCRGTQCTQVGVDLATRARTLGNISTATFVVGSAAVAAGVALYVTAPRASTERSSAAATAPRLVPNIGPAQIGLAILGGF